MIRNLLILFSFFAYSVTAIAQQPKTKEQSELEKERQQLKKEIEETQQLLAKNKNLIKDNLGKYTQYTKKLNLQEKIVKNLNKEIGFLDNNIVKSQRDVRKLNLLLDTLKQEYAKSMVYAYKNRSNSDFLNFIFSASSFNDAIRRVAYLKSYRSYREMQGDNILKTQALLKGRVTELNQTKQQKNTVLQTQDKEKESLATQQQEQQKIVQKLKSQEKELSKQIAAKNKQMQKVSNAIAAAIKRAQEQAKKEALAAAKAAEAKRKAEEKKELASNPGATVKVTAKPKTENVNRSSLLPTEADVKLNANFESNRGGLPWPVDRGYTLMHYGLNVLPGSNIKIENASITIGSDIGNSVKAVFDGEVASVTNIDDMQVVIIKHGKYFSTYSNLNNVTVSRDQTIRAGQVIGKVAPNLEGIGSIDLFISNERGNLNPATWLRRK